MVELHPGAEHLRVPPDAVAMLGLLHEDLLGSIG